MKVKIGNKIYNSEYEPILIILSPLEKEHLTNMEKEHLKYCSFPRGRYSQEEIEEFMKLKEGD